MGRKSKPEYKCSECGEITTEPLKAQNPFCPEEEIRGCPNCKVIESFNKLCEIEGRHNIATCGLPTSEGYLRICGDHFRALVASEL